MAPRIDHPGDRQLDRSLLVARVVVVLISLVLLALLGRVAQLQSKRFDGVQRLAETAGARQSTVDLQARRGALLDRQGRTLAVSRRGYRLFVDPQLIDDPDRFALDLAHAIGDDPARIDQLIGVRADRRYVVIDRLLDDDQVDAVRDLDRRAVGLEPRLVRHYPQGSLAGQLIGFVGAEHRGLEGMEYLLDARLRGEPGRLHFWRDARRRPVWVEQTGFTAADHGVDVRLSIDSVIQRITEQQLAAAAEHFHARAAQAVVMHATSGQVLALANWPRFDPRAGGRIDPDARRNRAVTDPYEPGSIFKPFVHAAATEAGVVAPDERIDCTEAGFFVTSGGRRLRDARGHGVVSWDRVLIESSNIGMALIGERLGAQRLHDAVRRFGFGAATGVGLPGESAGIVNPLRQWNHYSVTSVPMGQEIAVTPLQMVRAFSAFANRGLMVSPSILAAHRDTPLYQRVLDPEVADHTRRVLRRVIADDHGTGRRARSDRYRIWGKTGTAQVPDRVNGGYKDNAYTASFVCGAPLRRPQLIVVVVVHEPDPEIGYYGGLVAAPVAKRIVEHSLEYLGTPHDAPTDPEDTEDAVAHVR